MIVINLEITLMGKLLKAELSKRVRSHQLCVCFAIHDRKKTGLVLNEQRNEDKVSCARQFDFCMSISMYNLNDFHANSIYCLNVVHAYETALLSLSSKDWLPRGNIKKFLKQT